MLRIRKLPIIIFALFIIVFPRVSRLIPAIQNYPDLMIFAGIYSLITIGLSLLMGYAGQISLGQAAFYGIGAYVSAILTVTYGLNPWFCMVIGMIVAAIVAVLVGVPSLKLKGHYLAMATLAFGIIVFIIFNEEVEWTGGPDGMSGIPGLSLFGFAFDSVEKYYYLVWFFVFSVFVFTINVIQSRTGRALRAIHSSEAASSAMGINVSRFKVVVFVYSAILASLAGSLYAYYLNFINPSTFDLFFSIKLLIMIALGGMHDIWGAIIGAFLITFLSFEWLHFFEEFEVIVYGVILLLVIIFLPQGMVGIPKILKGLFNKKVSNG
ncbi:MAG: branched-chain amino acid ABC transporter permease [Desulfobacterales bacterium]|nr:branched-chain amino acid ABC transporter permease [Desulfobacterales bacterium]|tara:strand:+ start:2199 stop:3167 length:969 start_codon:yes stop_codon:yes gene_type:complete